MRFRRGRLYSKGALDTGPTESLQDELSAAFEKEDFAAVVDVTSKLLLGDPADIRSHMLRAFALSKVQQTDKAEFHRNVAIAMIESIVKKGDGRSFATAWTAFRVPEEYEVMKVLGLVVDSQALADEGERSYDILEAHKPDGRQAFRFYFDVTELLDEEGRMFNH